MAKQFKLTSADGSEIYVSEPVIDFLVALNEEDVEQLKSTVKFATTVQTLGKVARWTIMGLLAVTAALVSIITGIKSFFSHGG